MRSVLAAALFVVACGGDDAVHHLPDAPPAPDAVDAQTSGEVTITVTQFGAAVVDVPVYFQNADSSLVAMKMTDATGTASATMEPGGFVTASNPFPNGALLGVPTVNDLRTFAGVKPGDHLQLAQGSDSGFAQFTVTAPNDPLATEYKLFTTCSDGFVQDTFGSGATFTPTFNVFVTGCTTVDLAVLTFDDNAVPSKAFFHPAVAVANGATIDLTAETYVAPVSAVVNYTGVPAGFSALTVEHTMGNANGIIAQTNTSVDVTAGAASVSIPQPPVTGALDVIATALQPQGLGTHVVLDAGPQTNPLALSLANVLLPDYQTMPQIALATHQVTWTATAGDAQPDFVIADLDVFKEATSQRYLWTIAAPYNGTTIQLPTLPPALANLEPVADDTVNFNNLVTAKVPGGYDVVRSFVLNYDAPQDLFVGTPGRALVEDLRLFTQVRLADPVNYRRHVVGRR